MANNAIGVTQVRASDRNIWTPAFAACRAEGQICRRADFGLAAQPSRVPRTPFIPRCKSIELPPAVRMAPDPLSARNWK